jgi:hypothetical protein
MLPSDGEEETIDQTIIIPSILVNPENKNPTKQGSQKTDIIDADLKSGQEFNMQL